MNSNSGTPHAVVHVAVGVVVGDNGRILVARRHDHLHQGGLWEFPGGKIETGENVQMALARELREELSIQIKSTEPLIRIPYRYPDKSVSLDVWRVNSYVGEPHGKEGQPVRWLRVDELGEIDFPAANRAIVNAIRLPRRYLITGEFDNVEDFAFRLKNALNAGIRLVQLRAKTVSDDLLKLLSERARTLCDDCNARLVLNATPEVSMTLHTDGVHLDSTLLHQINRRPVPDTTLLGTSLHNAKDIEQANRIGVDFGVLSPVCATTSHPGETPLGWERFAELVELAAFPVYALGGMTTGNEMTAVRYGAQGIAAISAFWNKAI